MKTITEYLKETAYRYPSKAAMEYDGREYSWKDLDILSSSFCKYLLNHGVQKGEHVGILDYNGINWIIAFLALVKLGAAPALLNIRYTARELEEVLALSDIKKVCFSYGIGEEKYQRLCQASEGNLCEIIPVPPVEELLTDHDIETENAAAESSVLDEKEAYLLMYTSGSTAAPKCAILKYTSLLYNALSMIDIMRLCAADVICLSTPLYHIFSLCSNFLAGMIVGAKMAFPSDLSSMELLKCIQKNSCTIFNGVPTSFLSLITNAAFQKYMVNSIRLGVLGGDSVSYSQMVRIMDAFPNAQIMVNYGLTEGGFACNSIPGDDAVMLSDTVGYPMPGVQIAIADAESGLHLPVGKTGEILIKGDCIMLGYYHLPAQMQAIDREGYVHTGDLGYLREDGRLSVAGRKKNIIVRCGENISPKEVEKYMMTYPEIVSAVVVGAPHAVLGEEVVAFLVTENGKTIDVNQLKEDLKKHLAVYKIPSKIYFLESLPLMGNGKIDRVYLKKKAAELSEVS